MATADEVRDAIAENATGPRRAKGDEGEVEQHPLPDQVEVARYLSQTEASTYLHRGVRVTPTVMPGSSS